MTDFPNAHQSTKKEMDWNSPLVKPHTFTLLSEGCYPFKVVNFEKGIHEGDGDPCNVAKLRLDIINNQGNVVINHNFFLTYSSVQMISDFFASIGMTPEDGASPEWDKVVGKEGFCHIIQKKLDFRTINAVDRFTTRGYMCEQ